MYTKIDAPVEKFSSVYVNGKALSSSNYTVTNGSTVVTLNENYLKTLANGTYNVEIEFVSGARVYTPLTVNVAPNNASSNASVSGGDTVSGSMVNTSDITNTTILYALLGLSFLGLVVIRRRREKE
ncbi:MAG: hypothetical protein ACK5LC_05400 [Coprobacillaceae bacterium]